MQRCIGKLPRIRVGPHKKIDDSAQVAEVVSPPNSEVLHHGGGEFHE